MAEYFVTTGSQELQLVQSAYQHSPKAFWQKATVPQSVWTLWVGHTLAQLNTSLIPTCAGKGYLTVVLSLRRLTTAMDRATEFRISRGDMY